MKLNILFEDDEILVVEKPAGIESQSGKTFEPDMVSENKETYQHTIHKERGAICRSYPQTGQTCWRRNGLCKISNCRRGFKQTGFRAPDGKNLLCCCLWKTCG